MDQKNRFLTPLTIAAAVSVVAFASIGVAAITGYLSITQLSPNPFASIVDTSRQPATVVPASVKSSRKGLTRNETQDVNRPIDFRPGTRISARRSKCDDCGIVDSIRVKEAGSETAGIVAVGLKSRKPSDGMRTAARDASGTTYVAMQEAASKTRIAVNFVVTVLMEDGTVRKIYENQRPPLSIGERVRLVNGALIPLG